MRISCNRREKPRTWERAATVSLAGSSVKRWNDRAD
jgi:hypothetical protein